MTDVEITAKFSGNAFDPNSVQLNGGGFYDATNQSIVWNSQTTPDLANVEPGEKGDLRFKFKPISLNGTNIRNPEININISVRGRQSSLGNSFQTINDYIRKKVKYSSSSGVTGNALYYSGPFTNSGGLPARAGSPTTYTIVWNIAGSTSRLTNVKVRGILPFYVEWMNNWSPQSAKVSYDPGNHEVISAGPGRRLDNGQVAPMEVKVGDKVMFKKYSPDEIKVEGVEYLVIRESDVMLIVE
jgi:co-chaperonin GroES (HSP10)